jgi:NCAIR mutase (PurE)-related protein
LSNQEDSGSKDQKEVILDLSREDRTGLAEAIFCEGKQPNQLATICEQIKREERSMLFTRMALAQYAYVEERFSGLVEYDPVSKTGIVSPREIQTESQIAIVTGGSSDVPVAREASRTLEFYGQPSLNIDDVGVAGLWRVLDRVEELSNKKIIICIAGMDAALPTVLGGLVPSSIIAVPTSIGYGMAKDGETALRALLVSCAPGLTVVNIDNGYGAACAALRIINQFS